MGARLAERFVASSWSLALCAVLALACATPRSPQVPSIAVIAHRGAHPPSAENTLAAVQGAIELGADYVEVDVRTSADGALVLIHDRSVDRTTAGSGWVSRMTRAELHALGVPALDEALALAHGRIGMYLDAKNVSAQSLVAALERSEMTGNVVVYGSLCLLGEIARLRPDVRVMPETWSRLSLRFARWRLPLRIVALSDWAYGPGLVARARADGLEVFVDRLGRHDRPEAWDDAIRAGATGIQTDHPRELLEHLRARGLATKAAARGALD